jgi:hypothetical protein
VTDSADSDLTVVLVRRLSRALDLGRCGAGTQPRRPPLVCVDLPACRGTGTKLAGLAGDVQAVRAALDGCARPAALGTAGI